MTSNETRWSTDFEREHAAELQKIVETRQTAKDDYTRDAELVKIRSDLRRRDIRKACEFSLAAIVGNVPDVSGTSDEIAALVEGAKSLASSSQHIRRAGADFAQKNRDSELAAVDLSEMVDIAALRAKKNAAVTRQQRDLLRTAIASRKTVVSKHVDDAMESLNKALALMSQASSPYGAYVFEQYRQIQSAIETLKAAKFAPAAAAAAVAHSSSATSSSFVVPVTDDDFRRSIVAATAETGAVPPAVRVGFVKRAVGGDATVGDKISAVAVVRDANSANHVFVGVSTFTRSQPREHFRPNTIKSTAVARLLKRPLRLNLKQYADSFGVTLDKLLSGENNSMLFRACLIYHKMQAVSTSI